MNNQSNGNLHSPPTPSNIFKQHDISNKLVDSAQFPFLLQDPMAKPLNTSPANHISDSIPILSPPSSSSDRLSPEYPSSPTSPRQRSRSPTRSTNTFSPKTLVVDAQDVDILRKSATSHFRNLAYNVDSSKDSHLHLPGVTEDREDVSGMLGRLRLQKTEDSKSHLASRNWMDKQRKYLQAYEYLCHIGEAKEWIEECIDEEIPSVIQLEEALRDGVILAKLTRQFAPELVKRLYEAPKLQFRHTDNINYFFNFLDKVGMPNLFSFELTDLYDKKNIPKVIYCVHALGYVLSNAGLAPPIGNLVGKLEFTDAEIHKTQRGLDASGLKLPNFSSMGDHFGVEPEPEPEMSEEEILLYELTQREPEIIKLQSVSRGGLTRLSVVQTKRLLTKATVDVVLLQAVIRGNKTRKIVHRHAKRYAKVMPIVNDIQANIRGNATRKAITVQQHKLSSFTPNVVQIQNVIRGNLTRQTLHFEKDSISSSIPKIISLQNVIRGKMARANVSFERQVVSSSTPDILTLQSVIRGKFARENVHFEKQTISSSVPEIVGLQNIIRGKFARKDVVLKKNVVSSSTPEIVGLQNMIRGNFARKNFFTGKQSIASSVPAVVRLQNIIRGNFLREDVSLQKSIISSSIPEIQGLQNVIRGNFTRNIVSRHFRRNNKVAPVIKSFQANLRGNQTRAAIFKTLYILEQSLRQTVALQSTIRGQQARFLFDSQAYGISQFEKEITDLQSVLRGKLGRKDLARFKTAILSFNKDSTVVSLQSAVRANIARNVFTETVSALHHPSVHSTVVAPITTLQSVIKSKLLRSHINNTQTQLMTENQATLSHLQSIIRGKNLRYGFFAHKMALRSCATPAVHIQSKIRGDIYREQLHQQRNALFEAVPEIVEFESALRGALLRQDVEQQLKFINSSSTTSATTFLQSVVRAKATRKDIENKKLALIHCRSEIIANQAIVRGMFERTRINDLVSILSLELDSVHNSQAAVRGLLLRKNMNRDMDTLEYLKPDLVDLQSAIRGGVARNKFQDTLLDVHESVPETLGLQSLIRGGFVRGNVNHVRTILAEEEANVLDLQSVIRSNLVRQDYSLFMRQLDIHSPAVLRLQSAFRGVSTRFQYYLLLEEFDEAEHSVVMLQSLVRGFVVRKSHKARMDHFRSNIDKIIKIQSFVRAKKQGDSYKSLITSPNPPLETVKTFVHLLNDSDLDFEQEVQLEQSRKQVVHEIQHNEQLEQFISQLDVKIALLLKNKITIDEVVRHRNKAFANHNNYNSVSNLAISTPADMFDLKALNKTSRRRLEMYQGLFYILQTQPVYFARLFKKLQRSVVSEKEAKEIERLTICVFDGPLPKKRREEYFFLKLIGTSITEESNATGHNIKSVLRGNFMWWKLIAAMNRSSRERKTLRSLLQSPVTTVVTRPELDLESDPLVIYRKSISDEEIRTGQLSQRNPNISVSEAIKDPDTRTTYISNMQRLRELTTEFLNTVSDNVEHIPYHIRFVARELYNTGKMFANRPENLQGSMSRSVMLTEDRLLTLVGHVVFNLYLNPAIIAADNYGILTSALTPQQTRNLTEVTKMLSQIALLKPFSRDDVYLQPLNEYLKTSIVRMKDVFRKIINIPDVNQQFQMTIYDDLTSHQKPILAIKTSDIFAVHSLVSAELETMAPLQANGGNDDVPNDPLQNVIGELGTIPGDSSELLNIAKFSEIKLELNASFCPISDPSADVNALMVATKRCLIYVLRVQTGSSLLDILVSPVEDYHQHKFEQLLNEEQTARERKFRAKAEKKEERIAKLVKEIGIKQQQLVALENGNFNSQAASAEGDTPEKLDAKIEDAEQQIETLEEELAKVRAEKVSFNDDDMEGFQKDKIGGAEHHLTGGNESLGDLRSLSYRDLKRLTLEKVLELESYGKVSRENNYQDLLNSIAFDIRSKRDRRIERAREMGSVQSTLVSLRDKEQYLEQKLQTYNSYIEQSMATLQAKKAESHSKRQLLPFSKQYFHRKGLQKAGTLPKFGSYKYSAATMVERGILVNLNVRSTPAITPSISLGGGLSALTKTTTNSTLFPPFSNSTSLNNNTTSFSGTSPATGLNILAGGGGITAPHLDKVSITWSSDKVGVFKIEVAFGNVALPGATTELSLDYLLSFQYNNRQYISLFENMITLNTNLTLHFIFKKFYGQTM